jgi:spore maturation protein SpmA
MIMNVVWLLLFFVGGLLGLWKFYDTGDATIFPAMAKATFDGAKTGFELALGLTGALTLWMGIMKVGEDARGHPHSVQGAGPVLRRVFPGFPPTIPHRVRMVLEFRGQHAGLDNAATPAA